MKSARVISVAIVVMLVLALVAATFSYLNEGRLTLGTVARFLFFVAMAGVLRAFVVSQRRRAERSDSPPR